MDRGHRGRSADQAAHARPQRSLRWRRRKAWEWRTTCRVPVRRPAGPAAGGPRLLDIKCRRSMEGLKTEFFLLRDRCRPRASSDRPARRPRRLATATVSANGNIASGQTMNVDFQGTGGVVTAVLVEPGDRVRKGQALARVDATSARQALRQAEAQLASARAGYLTTTQGQTSQEPTASRPTASRRMGPPRVPPAVTSASSRTPTCRLRWTPAESTSRSPAQPARARRSCRPDTHPGADSRSGAGTVV